MEHTQKEIEKAIANVILSVSLYIGIAAVAIIYFL
jgi:hypothetical protein